MKQLNLHRPDEGVYGDCFRTAIACLLDYETPEAVPHFWKDDERGCGQQAQMNEWLEREHGLTLVEFPFHADDKYEKIMSTAAFYMNGCYYLLSGTSANGVGHYVICHAGEIVHDPSIGNAGIVGPLEGYYWIGILAKALRPTPSSDLEKESGGGPDDKGVKE